MAPMVRFPSMKMARGDSIVSTEGKKALASARQESSRLGKSSRASSGVVDIMEESTEAVAGGATAVDAIASKSNGTAVESKSIGAVPQPAPLIGEASASASEAAPSAMAGCLDGNCANSTAAVQASEQTHQQEAVSPDSSAAKPRGLSALQLLKSKQRSYARGPSAFTILKARLTIGRQGSSKVAVDPTEPRAVKIPSSLEEAIGSMQDVKDGDWEERNAAILACTLASKSAL